MPRAPSEGRAGPLSPLDDPAWLADQVRRGRTSVAIAREVGRDPAAVSRALRRHRLGPRRPPWVAVLTRERLEDLRGRGWSWQSIGEEHGLTLGEARAAGIHHGVVDVVDDGEQAVRLYAQGLTMREIGRRLGCDPATVRRRLRALGVQPRQRGRQPRGAAPAARVDGATSRSSWPRLGPSPAASRDR